MSELIDTKQIAEILKVRHEYVRDKLVKSGNFPPPALSLSQRMRRWKASDVAAWIDQQHAEQCR